MESVVFAVVVIIALLGIVAASGIKAVQQYQRGVVLRFGRLLEEVRQPGLRVIVPFVDKMTKVPVQTTVLDVPSQNAITRDNVTIGVDAVVYFWVNDPVRAVVNVDNYLRATSQVSQTSLRSVIGRADLDTLLSDRDQINSELKAVIDAPTEQWGVSIDRVEIKDIALPEGMRRSMSRQAEAERDRRARVISAMGELEASEKLSEASERMSASPGGLQLRLLQTVTDVASDKNSTLVMPLPIELLRFFDQATGESSGAAAAALRTAGAAATPPPPAPLAEPSLPELDESAPGPAALEAGPDDDTSAGTDPSLTTDGRGDPA